MLPGKKVIKMKSYGQARPRSRSPYNHPKEFLRWKQPEVECLIGSAPDSVWDRALGSMRKIPEDAVRRFNREQREREAKEALYNNGEPRLPEELESVTKRDGSLWGTVSFWSPKAKRMTKFEPADKSRGSHGAGPWSQSRDSRGGPVT